MNKLTGVCFGVAVVISFMLGAGLVGYKAEAEKQEMIAKYEKAVSDVEKQANARLDEEREQRAKDTSKLLARLHESHARERNLRQRAERLQHDIARSAKARAKNTGSCGACEKRLLGCGKLLSEGIDLVSEGAELVERIAIKKDGVADYVR